MTNRERNLGINIRVTPEEKKKISRYAKKCRLTLSEYIRKVAVRDEPKVFVPKEIEDSFLRITELLHIMEGDRLSETDPVSEHILGNYYADLLKITVDTLKLLRSAQAESEVTSDGNH